jgi:hypothetical protein
MTDRTHKNILILITFSIVLFLLVLIFYFYLDSKRKVDIIRSPKETLTTMSLEKAKILHFEYKKNNSTYIEFQVYGTDKVNRYTFSLKYDDIKINDEIHVIYNKKVFGNYIILEGIKSYEYEKKEMLIIFLVQLILFLYPIYQLIKKFIENNI